MFVAFAAVLSKWWLSYYLLNEDESMTERCGHRQRRCDRFEGPLYIRTTRSLPALLQVALLLLGSGLLYNIVQEVNPVLAFALGVGLLAPFLGFLLGTNTKFPATRPPRRLVSSIILHGLWLIGWLISISLSPLWLLASYTLRRLWGILHVLLWLPLIKIHHRSRGPPLPTT